MKRFILNLVYLLLSLPLGILYFTLLITGYSLGFGLLITLLGIPILGGMIFLTYTLADLERFFTSKVLGIEIIKPEARPSKGTSAWSILVAQTGNPEFWKEFLYMLSKMPIGIASFAISSALVSATFVFLAAPLIVGLIPDVTFMKVGNSQVDTMNEALLCSLIGVVLGALSIFVINYLATLLGRLTNWALGKA